MARISVIVPVYNTELYLRECLDSIKNQTLKDIEVICVDDGSTDNSFEILNSYALKDSRFKIVRKENGGVVSARLVGLEQAEGEFACFIDSDDWIEVDMLETLFEEIGASDLVSCGVYRYTPENKVVEETDHFEAGAYDTPEKVNSILEKMIYDPDTQLFQSLTGYLWNKLFRRELALHAMRRLDKKIYYGEDAVCTYKYVLRCRSIKIIKKCCYHYRHREGSAARSVRPDMLMNINRQYLNLVEDFKGHELSINLCRQLQRWIAFLANFALNEIMGFDNEAVSIPEFIIDTGAVKGKKIILYGAGKVGQDAYRQLLKFGYEIIDWVDKNFDKYREQGMNVNSPQNMSKADYDVVMLMANDQRIAKSMEKDLLAMGVAKEKIVWKKPMRFL